MTSSDARTLEVELWKLRCAGAQFSDLRERYDHARFLRDEKAEALSNRDRHCRWVDRMMVRDRRRRWVVRLDRKRKGERHRRWVARLGRMMKRDRRHQEAVSLGEELNRARIELIEQFCTCRQTVNGLTAVPSEGEDWRRVAFERLDPVMKDLGKAILQTREVNPEAQGGPTHTEILGALERREPAIRECGQFLADVVAAAGSEAEQSADVGTTTQLPKPVRRAVESFTWVCSKRPDLVADNGKPCRKQLKYIKEHGCPAYDGSEAPDVFETWQHHIATSARISKAQREVMGRLIGRISEIPNKNRRRKTL